MSIKATLAEIEVHMWMVFAAMPALAQVCPESPADVVVGEVAQMRKSYEVLDEQAFDEAHRALDHALSCLQAPLSPEQAVQVHVAKALGAFVDGEFMAVQRSWAAVKWLEPTTRAGEDWPEGHPMRAQFDAAKPTDARVTLERTPPGGWVVDGEPRSDVPDGRAFLLQGLADDGHVVHSGYHYSVAEVPQIDFAALDPTLREARRRRMHVVGTTVGGVLGAGSIASLSVGLATRARIAGEEVRYDDVSSLRSTANTAGSVSGALGAASLAVTTATWTIRW